jgi:hypothetical protein
MNPEQILGIISIFLLTITAILLITNKREGGYSFLALAFYLSQIIFLNLVSTGILRISPGTASLIGIWNNVLDAPLILFFLLYLAKTNRIRRTLLLSIAVFLAYALILYLSMGMNRSMLTMVIGPGLVLVSIFSLYFFVRFIQSATVNKKDIGQAFMSGGLVFTYFCFLLIYVLYYILRSPHVKDIYMIYYLTFIALCLAMITGICLIMNSSRKKSAPAVRKRPEDPNALQYL